MAGRCRVISSVAIDTVDAVGRIVVMCRDVGCRSGVQTGSRIVVLACYPAPVVTTDVCACVTIDAVYDRRVSPVRAGRAHCGNMAIIGTRAIPAAVGGRSCDCAVVFYYCVDMGAAGLQLVALVTAIRHVCGVVDVIGMCRSHRRGCCVTNDTAIRVIGTPCIGIDNRCGTSSTVTGVVAVVGATGVGAAHVVGVGGAVNDGTAGDLIGAVDMAAGRGIVECPVSCAIVTVGADDVAA